MNNAKTIKLLFIEMEAAEKKADMAEEKYTNEMTSESEIEFDTAYRVCFNATERLIKELCKLGYDAKTWRKVLHEKRENIRNLMFRLSA